MRTDLASAMLSATRLTRARKLMEATRVIQCALLLGDSEAAPELSEAPLLLESVAVDGGQIIDVTAEVLDSEIAPPQPQPWVPAGNFTKGLPQLDLPRFNLDGLTTVRPRKVLKVPEGADFLSRSFACAAGSRSYRLYVPARSHAGRRGLILMLHGGTQDAEDFAVGTRMNELADVHGFLVAYPMQSKGANASLCWNWFLPTHQRRGAGEPSIIAGITEEIVDEFDLDPDAVFVAGLSAGGAMAAVMGATYPEIYAGIGIHSGLPYRSAADVPSAFAAMRGDHALPGLRAELGTRGATTTSNRVPTIVFHGDADRIVHFSNAAKLVAAHRQPDDRVDVTNAPAFAGRNSTLTIICDKSGALVGEQWTIHGGGHAWSGGSPDGSYTDPQGPDASHEMLRFFLETRKMLDS